MGKREKIDMLDYIDEESVSYRDPCYRCISPAYYYDLDNVRLLHLNGSLCVEYCPRTRAVLSNLSLTSCRINNDVQKSLIECGALQEVGLHRTIVPYDPIVDESVRTIWVNDIVYSERSILNVPYLYNRSIGKNTVCESYITNSILDDDELLYYQ